MKFHQYEGGDGRDTAICMCPFLNDNFIPKVSVALSAAVAEVGTTLRTCHMIASLCTLDMDLQSQRKMKR